MNAEQIQHQLLIAMPTMTDPRFQQAVIYVHEYSAEGAMGLMINKPSEVNLGEIFQHLEVECADLDLNEQPVLLGGPMAREQGFILYPNRPLRGGPEIVLGSTRQELEQMAKGQGPRPALVCLGYAGWEGGQLETELKENVWLLAPATPRILFEVPFEQRWRAAAALLRVDFTYLSSEVGHA